MQPSALQNYLQVLRRQALVIVLVPLLAGSLAWLVSSRQTPVYRASMSFFVAQAGGGFQPVLGSQSLSQTMSNLLQSDIVARHAINDLNLDTSPDKLTKKLKVSFKPDSSVLNVSFDSTDKQLGVAILGRIAHAYTRLVDKELGVGSRGAASNTQPLSIIVAKVVDPPHLQRAQVSPKPAKNLGFGIALGLVLGIILGVARESLDDRVRNRRDAEEWFGAPVIGSLPKTANGNAPSAITGERKKGHEALMESLYAFRANLEFSQGGVSGPKVLITSAGESEGKTTVVAHMAVVLALAGKKVICVEADLRRPELHRYLGLKPQTPGIVNIIDGDLDLKDALQSVDLKVRPWVNGRGIWPRRNKQDLGRSVGTTLGAGLAGTLRVLTMGRTPEDPANLLATDALKDLFGELAASADYVIIDAPPLPIADTYPLVLQADNVLVVAKQGWTKRETALAVRETLEGLGAEKVALVLTNSSTSIGYA
jgi:capsular polysaccharide biosynthesis protein/Mrp family chromosome partitioning ATPase